jgi:DNA segregation ATPase FtsK/SpoIIIE-like protein
LRTINHKLDAKNKRNSAVPRYDMDEYETLAMEHFKTTGRVSVSSLQRRFSIGYVKAASIVDNLETKGLVSAPRSDHKDQSK